MTKVAVEAGGGVLAHRAGIDDDDVSHLFTWCGGGVTGALKEARHVLGVMNVHLTAECLDEIRTWGVSHACPATEFARVSRITVTLISPAKPKSFSMCSASVRANAAVPSSSTLSGCTTTRNSRPCAIA